MNLIPAAIKSWWGAPSPLRGRKFANTDGDLAAVIRNGAPEGWWSGMFQGFEVRKINPHLYEGLREAIGTLDGAINTTVTLDGIVRVQGDKDALVAEIEEFITNVPVNDAEKGLQAFYESQGNERYEQGFGIGEWVSDKTGRDIVGLRVADSKGVYFRRSDAALETWYRPPGEPIKLSNGLDNVESLLRNGGLARVESGIGKLETLGYTQLDTTRLLYTVNQPEADNPYGTSLLRSLEFSGRNLLVMQNAMARAWERYGDPPIVVVYKVANRRVVEQAGELDRRQRDIAARLRQMMEAKAAGNSVDLVQAIGKDDDFKIKVIGAEGVVLEIEMPARHLLEQVVAKVQIPPFMLGLQFSTSERMAEQQAGMALQASKTRWERRHPDLSRLVATMLRMRGRTWKKGDWKLVQELPNIQDQLKAAQAGFLRAQTGMMDASSTQRNERPANIDNNLRSGRAQNHKHARKVNDDDELGEDWADDDPELPRIERRTSKELLALWAALYLATRRAIGLAGDPGVAPWSSAPEQLVALLDAERGFLAQAAGNDSPIASGLLDIWRRGVANAAADLGNAAPVLTLSEAIAAQLRLAGLSQVRDTAARAYRERIVGVLASGALDNLPAQSLVRELKRRFDLGNYDWKRLVSSELVAAYGPAKIAEFRANGGEQYDWSTAGDGDVCPICAGHRDGGPYVIGAGPLPVIDSHPLCFPAGTMVRCSGLKGSTQRWYQGELVEIVTASGNELAVTPNHPILTGRGWVASGEVVEGDDLFRYLSGDDFDRPVAPNGDNAPSPIEQIAVTLGTAFPVPAVSVPGAAKDFHGDGMQADVDVVAADCLLQHASDNPFTGDQICEVPLGSVRVRLSNLLGQGDLGSSLQRLVSTAHRRVSSSGDGTPICGGHRPHSQQVGLTSIASFYAASGQQPLDRVPGTSVAFGDGKNAFALLENTDHGRPVRGEMNRLGGSAIPESDPAAQEPVPGRLVTDAELLSYAVNGKTGLIEPHSVIKVSRRHFSGLVFNLETESGWYEANGLVVHNCRCSVIPVL